MVKEIQAASQNSEIQKNHVIASEGDLSGRRVVVDGGNEIISSVMEHVQKRSLKLGESQIIDPEEILKDFVEKGFQPLLAAMQKHLGSEEDNMVMINVLNHLGGAVRWDDQRKAIAEMDEWLSLECEQIVEVGINKMFKDKKIKKCLDEKKIDIEQLRVRGQELMRQHVAMTVKNLELQTKILINTVITKHGERIETIRDALLAVDNVDCARFLKAKNIGWQKLSGVLMSSSTTQQIIMLVQVSLGTIALEESFLGVMEAQPKRASEEYLKDFCVEIRGKLKGLGESFQETPLLAVFEEVDKEFEAVLEKGMFHVVPALVNNFNLAIRDHYTSEYLKDFGPKFQDFVKRLSESFSESPLSNVFVQVEKVLQEAVTAGKLEALLSIYQQLVMVVVQCYQNQQQHEASFQKQLEEAVPLVKEFLSEGQKQAQVIPENITQVLTEEVAPQLKKLCDFIADPEILEKELSDRQELLEGLKQSLEKAGNAECAKVVQAKILGEKKAYEALITTDNQSQRVMNAFVWLKKDMVNDDYLRLMKEQPQRRHEDYLKDYSMRLLAATQRLEEEYFHGTSLAAKIKKFNEVFATHGKPLEIVSNVQQLMNIVGTYYQEHEESLSKDLLKFIFEEIAPNVQSLMLFANADEILKEEQKNLEEAETLQKNKDHQEELQEQHSLLEAVKIRFAEKEEYRGRVARFLEGWNQEMKALQGLQGLEEPIKYWDKEALSKRIEAEKDVLNFMTQHPEGDLQQHMLATAQKLHEKAKILLEEIQKNKEAVKQINNTLGWWDRWSFRKLSDNEPTDPEGLLKWVESINSLIKKGLGGSFPSELVEASEESLQLSRVVRCLTM